MTRNSGAMLLAVAVGLSQGAQAQNATVPRETKTPEVLPQTVQRVAEPSVNTERTFFLRHTQTQADQNEILIALRNLLGSQTKTFLVPWQNAIVIVAEPDQMLLVGKVIRELDVQRKVYRLTYTVTESESGKTLGVQHVSMVVESGQRTQMKQGNRVPLVTGTMPVSGASSVSTSTQVTYIDVGLNVDATVDSLEDGVGLRTKVEISSVAGEMTSTLSQDPIIRQTTLEGTSVLQLGKTIELGSLDVLGSTRHTQVEVVAELVK